jgi:major membrane immunogen (membrane-anchored lipoprotein)
MKKILTIALMAVATLLVACGKAEEPVTFDRLEDARQIAKSNSEFNAQMYKAQNPRFTADYSIVSRSDDTQSAKCPQGDGWAELSIMKVDGKTIDKTVLMCSTFSSSVGCYRKEDFDKNPNLAQQNGRCSTEVPFPIPALKK